MFFWALIPLALLFGYGLTTQGLWHDEGFSYLLATMPRAALMQALHSYNVSPPLWYLTCSGAISIFQGAPWAIRVPSLLATLGSCSVLFLWMRRRVSLEAGIFAVGIFASLPLAHFYAHEGRYYALLGFLYLCAVVATDDLIDGRSRWSAAILVVCSAALLYLHNYGVVLVVCLNGFFLFHCGLFSKEKAQAFRRWALLQAMVFVLFSPWVATFFQQLGLVKEKRILTYAWKDQNFLSVVLGSLRNLVPGDASAHAFLPLPHWPQGAVVLTAGVIVLILATSPYALRQPHQTTRFIFPMLVPLFFISLYSQFRSPAYLIGKTEAMVMPLSCGFLAFCLSHIKSPLLRRGGAGILVAAGLFGVGIYHFSPSFPGKHWDLLTTRRIFLKGEPDLTILSIQTTAAIASQLAPRAKPSSVILFPDPTPDALPQWQNHFLPLNAQPEHFEANVPAGLKNVNDALVGKKNIVLVLYSLGQKQGQWIYPDYTNTLLAHLKARGFVEDGSPASFPMDWISGFHIVRNYKMPG